MACVFVQKLQRKVKVKFLQSADNVQIMCKYWERWCESQELRFFFYAIIKV